MILQVLTHTRQMRDRVDAHGAQLVGVAHTRTLQQLRRSDGAAGDDHFATRTPRFTVAIHQRLDAHGTRALEDHAVGQHARQHRQRGTLACGIQIAERRAGATALGRHGAVHRAKALLAIAVQIVGGRNASLLTGFDKGMEQQAVVLLGRGDLQRASIAVPVVGALVVRFRLAEVRQAIRIRPIVELEIARPALVVHRVAADETHAVDE